jgi:hypothetical protein
MSRISFARVGLLVALLYCSCTQRQVLGQTAKATGGHGFYLDSLHGADSNPGTQAAPWKTLKKIDGRTFGPGG